MWIVARPSRRELILTAARTAFTSRGYDGTSVGDIAEEVGVTKSVVSFHFPAKDLMLAALVEPLFDELDSTFDRHPSPSWPLGVVELAEDYFEVLLRHRDVAIWVDSDRSVQARYEERVSAMFERMVDAITGPDAEPQSRVRALAAVGGIWRPLRTLSPRELREHRTILLVAALISYAPLD